MAAEQLSGPVCHGLTAEELDPGALTRLASELESDELARSIAHTYLRMLDARLTRAASALERRDEVAAMDVLLSLRVSSATVGLVRLESAVRCVIDAVRRGEHELARQRGASMRGLADGARLALCSHLETQLEVRRDAHLEHPHVVVPHLRPVVDRPL
ncbi:hypothetical protein GCM10009868_29810 [Terrabacter aerolatus]|uniref:HPt domain-containing protein n=1 Tax=Terrabacter aerolatus TaxID=422442 RepID=A0A512CXM7_9MICO|nr:hypothetical protein [Terrabacter aerolatus]GEO28968.1 hypothetical protein TAE01_07780 [Terrabacter aerolatus]